MRAFALVAFVAAVALSPWGEARAQVAHCTPTQTVSSEPDADGVYTTTLACADTAAAAGEADYTYLPLYDQYSIWNRDTTIDNNERGNHVKMTIQNGLVLVGDLDDDTPSVHELGVVRLRGENDVALVIEEGAIIDVKNELWAFAVESWGWNIGWRDNYGVVLWGSTKTEAPATANAQGGDLTIRLDGEIKLDQSYLGAKLSADGSVIQGPDTIINPATDAELTWSQYGSNGNALSLFSQDTDNDRNDNDILIELGATGVIRNVAGSVGGNGIYADQRTEAGGITINLAKGSLIDVSAEGGRGLNAWLLRTGECKGSDSDPNDDEMVLCDPRQTGDIVIGAHGTIRAAVKRKVGNPLQGSGISAYMGVATSEAMGRLRIVSSGTIETVQGPGIDARISSPANAQVDDPDTAAIEGHLIDVTGGRIVAKGSSAIGATTAGAAAAWTIRVARGATVRAEGRAGPGAITKAMLEGCVLEMRRVGCRYTDGAGMPDGSLKSAWWWDVVDTDGNDLFDRVVPSVNGIVVLRGEKPSDGVTDRVLIDGTVEVVEGDPATADESDEELGYNDGHGVYLSHGGTVVVGATGRLSVSTESGAAIVSGVEPPDVPGEDYEPGTGRLDVSVAGSVTGDIRVLDDGDLTAMISGAVAGNVETLGDGDLTAAISGAVDGDVKALGDGDLTAMISGTVDGNVEALGDGDLTATISGTVAGNIKARGDGDLMATISGMVDGGVEALGGGEHTVTVATGGAVSARIGAAISLGGNGAVSVFGTATGGSHGVFLSGNGTVTVHEGAAVTGARHGIEANDPYLGEYRQGDISIVSRGRVAATGTRSLRHGILAQTLFSNRENNIEIDVGGGAVETAGWSSAAIFGWHRGLGSVSVEIGASAVARAKAAKAVGVSVGLSNDLNAEGRVVIRHAGAIEAGDHGILAWAKRSSGSTFDDGSITADDAARTEPMIHVVSSGTVTVRKPEEERASRDDLSAEDLRDLQDLDESNGVRFEALQELDNILDLVEVGVGAYARDGWQLVDTIAGGDNRLSPAERAVLAAAATGGDLKAALAALPASAPYIGFNGEQIYGDEYRNTVQRLAFANAYNSGDIRIDITGGRIDSSGDGVVAFSGFPHDRNGAMTVNVEAGAVIAAGRYGILVDGGGLDGETGQRKHFVSVDGSVSGASAGVRLPNGGTVSVGSSGRVSAASGVAIDAVAGDLIVSVDGSVSGASAGIRLPNGGTVSVGSSGRVSAASGVAIDAVAGDLTAMISGAVDGDVKARGDGDLMATISGMVDGGVEALGNGEHTVTVAERAAVSGTVRLASPGVVTVGGAIGSAVLDKGGALTVRASGSIAGVNGIGVQSGSGDLTVDVAGKIMGDVRARGNGEHTVTVAEGGAVSGTIHLAGSTVTVRGSVGCVVLDNGGAVNVGASGRISCPDGGVQSGSGDLTVDVAGNIMGDVRAGGDGEHMVVVAEGAAVSGTVRLASPGGVVTVGGVIGSAVLDKGGMVTVGENGRVEGVQSSDVALSGGTGELEVVIEQAAGESASEASKRVNGRIIERDGQAAQVYFKTAGATGSALPVGKVGTREAIPEGAFDVGVMADGSLGADYAPRTRVYEALPSVLLGLAALPTHRDRMAAVRTPNGAWARIEAGGGERKAKRSESTDKIGYDHRHWGVQTGVDVLLGEDALVGVAAHHRRGTAELSGNDGDIEAAGTGLGVSGAWTLEDGAYIDAQVSATWFKADLESGIRGLLKSDAEGFGHAAGVEAGRRIGMGTGPLGELSLTPSLRLAYSRVDIDNFTDSVGSRVSLDKGRSMTGRVGVSVETEGDGSRLFGSLDVEQEFAPATRVGVSGTDLSSEAEPLRGQLELGGSHVWDEGRFALQGVARYAAGRGGNRDYSGGLNLKMRF